jgi:hypothetical protein
MCPVRSLQVFNVFDKGRVQQLEGELKTLYIVNCPSLVRFHGVYKSDEKVCVFICKNTRAWIVHWLCNQWSHATSSSSSCVILLLKCTLYMWLVYCSSTCTCQ